jgi:hypothetical protein
VASAAAVFAAGEIELIAQDPKQQAVGIHLEPEMLLIDHEFHT